MTSETTKLEIAALAESAEQHSETWAAAILWSLYAAIEAGREEELGQHVGAWVSEYRQALILQVTGMNRGNGRVN